MKRTRHFVLRALSVVTIGLLLAQTGTAGQSTAGLVIQVLEANAGENLTEKELPPTKVRVMDRTGRLIPEASVVFVAPEEGPTGHFLPDSSEVTVITDSRGMATTPRFRTNAKVGEYQIQVVASYRSTVSRASIPHTNVFKLKSSSRKKFVILGAVIGGAAAAALATGRGGSGPASSALGSIAATPTISFGGSSGGSSVGLSTPTIAPVPSVNTSTSVVVPSTSGSTGTSPSSGSMQTPVTTSPLPDPCDSSPSKNKKSCR